MLHLRIFIFVNGTNQRDSAWRKASPDGTLIPRHSDLETFLHVTEEKYIKRNIRLMSHLQAIITPNSLFSIQISPKITKF